MKRYVLVFEHKGCKVCFSGHKLPLCVGGRVVFIRKREKATLLKKLIRPTKQCPVTGKAVKLSSSIEVVNG